MKHCCVTYKCLYSRNAFLSRIPTRSMRRHRVFSKEECPSFGAITESLAMEDLGQLPLDPANALVKVADVAPAVKGPEIAEQSVVEGEINEDYLWMDELDLSSIADVGVENCDFGFGNDEASKKTEGDLAMATGGDQEIQNVAGLRPLPHPELVQAGKGKEKSPSAHNDSWAVKRADQLRKSMGWDMRIRFGDLPLDQIDDLLSNLFARAVKVSGEEYPASTLMNMLGGFAHERK